MVKFHEMVCEIPQFAMEKRPNSVAQHSLLLLGKLCYIGLYSLTLVHLWQFLSKVTVESETYKSYALKCCNLDHCSAKNAYIMHSINDNNMWPAQSCAVEVPKCQ